VGDLVMILVVLTDPDRFAAIKRLLMRTASLLVPVSILLIKYYPDLGRGYDRWDGRVYNLGVTTNKNTLGVICLVLGLGILWRLLEAYRIRTSPPSRRQMTAQGVVLAMVVWLLSISNSMTSLACFLLAGGLMVITRFSEITRKRAVIHLLVVVLLSGAYSVLVLGVGSNILDTMGRNPTLTGRTGIWRVVLGMVEDPVFGTGFESFWLGQRPEKVRIAASSFFYLNEAHNGYLEVFLNLGWVGIALLTFIMVTGYRDIVNSLQWDPDAARLRLAFFIAGAIYSFTEAGFRMLNPVWIFFLFSVIAVPEPLRERHSTVDQKVLATALTHGPSGARDRESLPSAPEAHAQES
jgi:exopolysaccharide production protein ExoQ